MKNGSVNNLSCYLFLVKKKNIKSSQDRLHSGTVICPNFFRLSIKHTRFCLFCYYTLPLTTWTEKLHTNTTFKQRELPRGIATEQNRRLIAMHTGAFFPCFNVQAENSITESLVRVSGKFSFWLNFTTIIIIIANAKCRCGRMDFFFGFVS